MGESQPASRRGFDRLLSLSSPLFLIYTSHGFECIDSLCLDKSLNVFYYGATALVGQNILVFEDS
jgi:hypothetical protein